MKFTPAQISNTRRRAREFERQALDNARSLHKVRKEMRTLLARQYACQWDVEYYAGHPWRDGIAANLPRHQRTLDTHAEAVRKYEESMAINVRAATAEKRVLDRYARAQAPRREPGLWVLLQVCLRGWLAGRGKRC